MTVTSSGEGRASPVISIVSDPAKWISFLGSCGGANRLDESAPLQRLQQTRTQSGSPLNRENGSITGRWRLQPQAPGSCGYGAASTAQQVAARCPNLSTGFVSARRPCPFANPPLKQQRHPQRSRPPFPSPSACG